MQDCMPSSSEIISCLMIISHCARGAVSQCHGKCHGKGLRTYKGGRTYSGDWEYNDATGKGVEIKPIPGSNTDCDKYDGEYIKGQRHGWGRMWYATGDVYEGEWEEGSREGFGEFDFFLPQPVVPDTDEEPIEEVLSPPPHYHRHFL
ncbi:hypothetical protein T484DRAFT_1779535 [Baffinella frigidus]|nr:hypothetical protein T484DRAFT_1779535 [Cryptophyta sp. CCMP2293]